MARDKWNVFQFLLHNIYQMDKLFLPMSLQTHENIKRHLKKISYSLFSWLPLSSKQSCKRVNLECKPRNLCIYTKITFQIFSFKHAIIHKHERSQLSSSCSFTPWRKKWLNLLQYSCLENPMAIAHRVTKRDTTEVAQHAHTHTHTHTCFFTNLTHLCRQYQIQNQYATFTQRFPLSFLLVYKFMNLQLEFLKGTIKLNIIQIHKCF